MPKYGSSSVVIWVDDAPGGTARDISQYVTEFSGLKVETNTEPTHAFGDSWEENTPTGVSKMGDITLGGFYDTSATDGPHVVFSSVDSTTTGDTRTLTFAPGGSQKLDCETRLVSYEVAPAVGSLSKFTAVLRPTGTVTWSTST
jgi:hypothetical protein